MSYERGFGEIWQGLLSDGYFNLETIASEYLKHTGHEVKFLDSAITDLIVIGRKKYQCKEGIQAHKNNKSTICKCLTSFDFMEGRIECENYVLFPDNKDMSRNTKFGKSHCAIVQEFENAEPNRTLMLTLSNCKDLYECTKDVLENLGFVVRPKEGYRDYEKFSVASQSLIEEAIAYFEAPCVRVLEYLKKRGFTGYHETCI